MTAGTSSSGSLSGVRILDMATVVAAPFGATLCADHGADVIKLELPDGSDALRSLQPIKDGKPLWWKTANRGKRGITLDVRKDEGRKALLRMLPKFDVLVENFRTGTMDKWGLDAATLFAANPRLIILRLTGFGQTGPYKSRPGFARIFEAMSGFTNLTGPLGGPPLHSNFPVGDAVAGLFSAFAITAEIVRLRRSPEQMGAEIDLSATEALFRFMDPLPIEYEQLDQVRTHQGNTAGYTAPSDMYCSQDGVYFSLVASSNPTFKRLCICIGKPEWASHEKFSTNSARVRNMSELDTGLRNWFEQCDYAAICERLEAQEVPFSKVYSIEDIVKDPHFSARESIIRLEDPDFGSVPAPCIVPRVIGRTMSLPRSGPGVGEHNQEVYGEMGFSPDEISQLHQAGAM
ncbi:CaiB/BaiF CoA transferase family protein [Allopusillimonas ginsengisoli]|uniref:CaiB/BaiF CoA transferase family protein n=1 Tax=Allopusillimonas ginsengisoli TaxID=453575 RepID=UPI0010C19A30|nr:CoA transferase [Allopusillimonas ginsengisoli]